MRRLIWLMMLMFAWPAFAQDLEATATYIRKNQNNAYDIVVLNSSASDVIESVEVTMQNGLQFDTAQGNPTPSVGTNNDSNKSATLTWITGLAQGQMLDVGGDVDGNAVPQTIEAVLSFRDAGPRAITLVPSGTPDQWVAIVSETSSPPSPIINGEGTATLTWVAPTQKENGDPLDDLAGFVVYWDQQSRIARCSSRPDSKLDASCYGNALDVEDGTSVTEVLTLPMNQDTTLYFTVIAYNTQSPIGLSEYSNEVAKRFVLTIIEEPDSPPGSPTLTEVQLTFTCTTDQEEFTCEFSEVSP